MITWNETIKTALLGTNRAKLAAPPGKAALGQLLNQIPQQDDAAALLAIAGTVALHQQTGWQPQQTTPPTANAPLPDQPLCPPHISYQIEQLLVGSQVALLTELLTALAQTGHRLPESLLPNLLNKGSRLARLRPYLLPVLGAKGQWLASQNPAWAYALLELADWPALLEIWQTAVPGQRHTLLRQLRLTQPERGRQLLEHTWKSSNDTLRHQLIKILDSNLSQADEPFLELALDDRNHLVRRAAADLLARLPHSRLSQRMPHHAAGILSWTPAQKQAITIRLPQKITPAMQRDGIPNINVQERAKSGSQLLNQIISRVPLTHWLTQWPISPQQFVQAALNSAWPRTLISALSVAAFRQNNERWAKELILANQFNTSTGRLVPVLSTSSCFQLMQQAAKQSTALKRPNPLYIFLQHWQQHWTAPMAEFWLDLFAQHLQQEKDQPSDPTMNNLFKRFAEKCPPELAETAVAKLTTIPGLNSAWQKNVNQLCHTLQLRHTLLAEIHRLNVDD
ncbi:MAG: hypothetical protein H6656_21490 [Ardenticatenaceae bacterium]|nr:hypothetical protein [Ardenticatenaceae bacterium]